MKKNILIKNGTNFECQGSGNCCVSRGLYGYVYLSLLDRKRLAKFFNLSLNKFTKKFCNKNNKYYHLKELKKNEDCIFLVNKKCSVYKSRPIQCRTWPFWKENLNSKGWRMDIYKFCPGIGKGKFFSKKNIQKIINEDEKNNVRIEIDK